MINLLKKLHEKNLVPFLVGPVGVGKSSICKQLAEEYDPDRVLIININYQVLMENWRLKKDTGSMYPMPLPMALKEHQQNPILLMQKAAGQ